jgi:hypothetical protein
MTGIADRVKELTPMLEREKVDRWDDDLVEAIQQALPFVTDFARIADAAAVHNSEEAALGLFRGFAPLLAQYDLAPGKSGYLYGVEFDFPKFIGHELMVTLFATFIEERRWKTVAEMCRETVVVPNASSGRAASVTFVYASKPVALLDHRNARLKKNRVSLHADILKERHEHGQLGQLCPWRGFQDADVFLYLRSVFETATFDLWKIWRPWSAAFSSRGSIRYLLEATRREKAEQLLEPLGVKDLAELRTRLKDAAGGLHQLFGHRNPFYEDPFEGLQPELIGSK